MQLVWSTSGDSIDIEIANKQLIDYWFEQLTAAKNNNFNLVANSINHDALTQLSITLTEINRLISKIGITDFKEFENQNLIDQTILNRLHETWVKSHYTHPKLVKFIVLADKLKEWNDINSLIHTIETSFNISYTNSSKLSWQVLNPFGPDILTSDVYQIELEFQNLGRSTWDKWKNFDNNIHDLDTNNFTHIGGQVDIKLIRPMQSTLPLEYIKWCADHQTPAYGYRLPIGNFKDYKEKLTKIRQLFVKNTQHEDNRIFFTL